jgi:hypothetical protein
MLKTLSIVPTMLLPAVLYALLTPFTSTSKPIAVWNLSSGDMTVLTTGQIILLIAIVCLGVEVIKATRMSAWGMADHVASLALLLVMAILYLTVFGYGNGTWFLLCAMQTCDVAIGVIVSVSVARRDFGGGLPFIGGGNAD